MESHSSSMTNSEQVDLIILRALERARNVAEDAELAGVDEATYILSHRIQAVEEALRLLARALDEVVEDRGD
jgi:hypothetical protein